ncbi:MAG TPA: hypothetical protein VGI45_21770 [Terracidiphilus sp.]|jgi:hypothetical protein
MNQLATPVALIVFNRPETTRRVFSAVAAARPERLLLIADGPRASRPEEGELCAQVKEIVSRVDWPCRVETNFAAENMGCRRRVISGLNWVFSLVEEAIILEDDCLPDPSFFPFCAELLERYRDQAQIGHIAGFNPFAKHLSTRYSYFFSAMISVWGWATWRRAWQEYDEQLRLWPQLKAGGFLSQILPDKRAVAYWSRTFDAMYEGTGPNTWDFQWVYTCWTRNWLSIVPSRNLIQNIGFGADATHTTRYNHSFAIPATSIQSPFHHPPEIAARAEYAKVLHRRFYTPSILRRVGRKVLMRFGHAN